MPYRHTQTNRRTWLLFVPVAIAVVGVVVLGARAPGPPIWLIGAVLVLVAVLTAIFSVMTVEVSDHELTVGFGLGMMRRRIPLTDIARVERASIPWWYGTGIKLGPKRTSYLVASGPAVAVELKNGRIIQIGTDDPDALLAALTQRRRS
jgi:hypothetical protein